MLLLINVTCRLESVQLSLTDHANHPISIIADTIELREKNVHRLKIKGWVTKIITCFYKRRHQALFGLESCINVSLLPHHAFSVTEAEVWDPRQ